MVRIVAASLASIMILVLLVGYPLLVGSQSNQQQPQLNKIIQDVLKAESAGAQPEEMTKLAAGLNSALSLEGTLQNLTPQDSSKQLQLLTQINTTLTNVDAEANQIEINASQRTLAHQLITYSLGAILALIATLILNYIISLRRTYRAKRVLRMKIVPK